MKGRSGPANPMFGKTYSDEERQRQSERMRLVLQDPEIRHRLSESHKGKTHSEETKAKMRLSMRGLKRSAEGRLNIRESAKKRFAIPENNVMYGKTQSAEAKRKIGINSKKVASRLWSDPRFKQRMVQVHKARWSDPEYRNQAIRRMAQACHATPNKPESAVLDLLNNMFPNEWEYVGNGQLILAGMCPDFVNVNGQKKIIELFGDYWHRGEDPKDRAAVFAPFGYETLVIWERELKDMAAVAQKIESFAKARK